MTIATPPPIDPVPTPAIQRNDRATFSGRLDALILWLVNAVTQFAAIAANVYANALDAYNSALSAASSASAAVSVSSAVAWVSGATYAVGDCCFSPITMYTYRRRVYGAGTTDPSIDNANWTLISAAFARTQMYVREQQASGTHGGGSTAATTHTRTLNTVAVNTISGASLASNQITLPAGTYDIFARAPVNAAGGHKATIYNVTDSTVAIVGSSASSTNSGLPTDSVCVGQITIAATKIFQLRHYTASTVAINGLGVAVSSGQPEVYAEVKIEKVA